MSEQHKWPRFPQNWNEEGRDGAVAKFARGFSS